MTELLAFLTITVLAVISPGADFAMVSRNSLLYSRRAGLLTALGIGAGVTVHVGYSILGVGVLVRESLALFTALKLAGAAYLVFLGLRMLLARGLGGGGGGGRRRGFVLGDVAQRLPDQCAQSEDLPVRGQPVHAGDRSAYRVAGATGLRGLHRARPRGLVRPGRLLLSSPAVRGRLLRFRRRIDQFFGALLVGFGVLLGAKSP